MLILDQSGQVPDKPLGLVTRLGKVIDNIQSWQLTTLDWNPISAEAIRSHPNARRLSEACPVYNCHGLTFASRRTAVTQELQPILDDDGYSEIREGEAREGDLAVYYEDGEVTHTGFVIGREKLIGSVTSVRVWSKWNRGPEMSHLLQECPYFRGEDNIKFYRMTEWRESWRNIAP
jgi:hypothetical protein